VTDLFLLILLLIVVAIITRVDFIVYVAYVLIAVFAWSRFYVPRSLQKLQISRYFHARAFLGEPVEVKVHLTNAGRLPILWLQLTESIPPEMRFGPSIKQVIHLGPRKERRLQYQVRAMKRGYYRLGPLQITAGDLFGFQESQAILEPSYLTVYPRIIPLKKLNLPSRLPFGTLPARQRLFEDPARPHGVRDYRLGDSLRLVNWKASAHTGVLSVRTHQPAISLETTILLNLNSPDYSNRFRRDGPDWAIVVAASLASHLVAQRQAVGLASNGADPLQQQTGPDDRPLFEAGSGRLTLAQLSQPDSDIDEKLGPAAHLISDPIPPGAGRSHLMQVLERLARLEGAPTVNFAHYAYQATHKLNWGVTLLTIVPDADQDVCDTMHRLVRAGFNVVLLVIEAYANFSSVRERARLLGFSAYHVPDIRALRRWQEGGGHGQ